MEKKSKEAVEAELVKIVDNSKNIKQIFNKKVYEDNFQKLRLSYVSVLADYHEIYETDEDPKQYAESMAKSILKYEMSKINAIEKKSTRKMQMMEDSAYTALFVIPVINECHTEASDALADALVEEWHKYFPDNQIRRGTFDAINEGFKKRKFCYVTTAVCRSMDKSDHCEELEILRCYRDSWLVNEKDGEKLIELYYDTAPGIIARIDSRTDAASIYLDIYHRYLVPCIEMIHDQKYELCKETYMNMVNYLDRGDFHGFK